MGYEEAMSKIGVGSAVILGGLMLGNVLDYGVKVIMTRFLGSELYGVFIQGYAVVGVLSILALFGFQWALPRFASFYKGGGREGKISEAFKKSLYIVIPLSAVFSISMFFASERIALLIFNEELLVEPLKILSIGVFIQSLLLLTIAYFRGLQKPKLKVYISDILLPLLQLSILTAAFIYGMGVKGAIYAYILALLVTLSISCYICSKLYSGAKVSDSEKSMVWELLKFSWPLFLISIFTQTTKWFDIIMLGWLKTSSVAGIYEVSFALAGILPIFLKSMSFMFLPVISELYGGEKHSQIREVYSTSTRWVVTATLPLVAGMLIFPAEILNLLFGSDYTGGALSLVILAIGFFLSIAVGPAGLLLLSFGETKKVMEGSAVTAAVNVLLNLVLISIYGMVGAAVAMSIGLVLGNIMLLFFASREIGGHHFNKKYLKPLSAILVASFPIVVVKILLKPGVLESVFLGVLLSVTYLVVLLKLEGIYDEEIKLFNQILGDIRSLW